MTKREFIRSVRDMTNLTGYEAELATRAVFRTLHERTTEGEADDVAATLPPDLQDMWDGGYLKKLVRSFRGAERFDLQTFLARVQQRALLANVYDAERISRAVLHVLKDAIPPGEVEDLEAQLPYDMKQMLEAA